MIFDENSARQPEHPGEGIEPLIRQEPVEHGNNKANESLFKRLNFSVPECPREGAPAPCQRLDDASQKSNFLSSYDRPFAPDVETNGQEDTFAGSRAYSNDHCKRLVKSHSEDFASTIREYTHPACFPLPAQQSHIPSPQFSASMTYIQSSSTPPILFKIRPEESSLRYEKFKMLVVALSVPTMAIVLVLILGFSSYSYHIHANEVSYLAATYPEPQHREEYAVDPEGYKNGMLTPNSQPPDVPSFDT